MRIVEAGSDWFGSLPDEQVRITVPAQQWGQIVETSVTHAPRALPSSEGAQDQVPVQEIQVIEHPHRAVRRGVPFSVDGERVPDGIAPVVFAAGVWLQRQRLWRGRGRLTADQRARLERLPGFTWPSGSVEGEAQAHQSAPAPLPLP